MLTNRALNQVQVGYSGYGFTEANLTTWSAHPLASRGITNGHPRIQFNGFNIAGNNNWPRYWYQNSYNLRDDFTWSYDLGGRHDVKAGGEFMWWKFISANCTSCMGRVDARGGPLPSAAQMEAWFPDPFNVDTWNLNAISNITRRYVVGISDSFPVSFSQPKYAAWWQDDWRITPKLTLNLGVRYDYLKDAFNNDVQFLPWMVSGRPQDADNIQPRIGAAYSVDDRTVIRGGAGLYYTDVIASSWTHSTRANTTVFLAVDNDGRPDFVTNPVQRSRAELPAGAAARLRRQHDAVQCVAGRPTMLATRHACSATSRNWRRPRSWRPCPTAGRDRLACSARFPPTCRSTWTSSTTGAVTRRCCTIR